MSSLLKKMLAPASSIVAGSPEPTSALPDEEADSPENTSAWVRKPPSATQMDLLRSTGVPLVSLADCQGCASDDECETYPKGFRVNLSSDLLGNVKPFGRMVLVSTGKTDWEHDVLGNKAELAGSISKAYADHAEPAFMPESPMPLPAGVFLQPSSFAESSVQQGKKKTPKLKVLNSSHLSHSHDDYGRSIMVFPDWKLVTDATPTKAHEIVRAYLSSSAAPSHSHGPSPLGLHSIPLPYRAVILLCSHKRRDRRCHIAAPLLAGALSNALHARGIHVDERGELLDFDASRDACELWPRGEALERWKKALQMAARGEGQEGEHGAVGIFKVSHVGGHKFAGNVIINFPSGASVWYGRVTPKDCAAIVEKTILEGRVIAELLRGGAGITDSQSKPCGVLEW